MGRGGGGGQMISVLAFYFNDTSLNPADAYSFLSVEFVFEKNQKNKKRGRGCPPPPASIFILYPSFQMLIFYSKLMWKVIYLESGTGIWTHTRLIKNQVPQPLDQAPTLYACY